MKKPNKAKPRKERTYPQVARVMSTNIPEGFAQAEGKCYVPLEDYNKLRNKYLRLFKRYNTAKDLTEEVPKVMNPFSGTGRGE